MPATAQLENFYKYKYYKEFGFHLKIQNTTF